MFSLRVANVAMVGGQKGHSVLGGRHVQFVTVNLYPGDKSNNAPIDGVVISAKLANASSS